MEELDDGTTTEKNKIDGVEELKTLIKQTWLDNKGETQKFNVVVGFDPAVWEEVNKGVSGWQKSVGKLEQREKSHFILPQSQKFINGNGVCCIVVRTSRGLDKSFARKVKQFHDALTDITSRNQLALRVQKCDSKDVISGVYVDGLANKTDPNILQESTACIGGVNGYPGGSYMLQQKFEFTWDILGQKNASDIARMIGRQRDNTILLGKSARAHIVCAHVTESSLNARSCFKLHRISMPYTRQHEKTLEFGGANKEDGIFYMSVGKSTTYIKKILENISGPKESVTNDLLISTINPLDGAFYYIPAMKEFDSDLSIGRYPDHQLLLRHWNVKPKNNNYLFYNHKEYLNRMGKAKDITSDYVPYPDPLSDRVLILVKSMFEQWETTWFKKKVCEPIPHLEDFIKEKDISTLGISGIVSESLVLRRAWAVRLTLEHVFTTSDFTESKLKNHYGQVNDLFQIHPQELIAGKMPAYGLGIGQIAMPYFKKDISAKEMSAENIMAYSAKLNEASGYGHVVPGYQRILQKGVPGFLKELESMIEKAIQDGQVEKKNYLQSCSIAFTGVQKYIENYGLLAEHLAKEGQSSNIQFVLLKCDVNNMSEMATRLKYLARGNSENPTGRPTNFHEAVQLLFILHACQHLCTEPVSIGRLDVMLEEFYDLKDEKDKDKCQDIIDAFWIKVGERAQINRETRLDLYTAGTIAVPYRSDGRFPRGDGGNQWVQQATVGGYTADKDGNKIAPSIKRIEIAKLCLKAARRLPLNAPCLSLRMHSGMDRDVLKEATKTILSGGAHPILPHDDRIIPALVSTGISLKDAINYSSDGCYEPIIPGKSEFSFCYVPLLAVLEMTLNRGATMVDAGPAGMRGYTISRELRPGSDQIRSLDDIKDQFGKHLRLQIHDALTGLLSNYGNIYKAYSSQLLSCLIDGCLEDGKDIYNGGAAIKIIACMLISFSNTVNSLYAIQEICFGEKSIITLDSLVRALKSDWGYDLQEPLQDPMDGELSHSIKAENMKLAREFVLNLPKLGMNDDEKSSDKTYLSSYRPQKLKNIAEWLSNECVEAFKDVTTSDKYPLYDLMKNLNEKYGRTKNPADFIRFMLGSGTFEGYVGWGLGLAASADGRRKGQPIASDMSPAPIPQDLADTPRNDQDIYDLMKYWDIEAIKTGYPNGAEVDLVIDEDTKEEYLLEFLTNYANADVVGNKKAIGANLITLTCANQSTYRAAMKNPEQYDLIRVRTGGWTEFFVSFYSAHQLQHLRRTYAIVNPAKSKSEIEEEEAEDDE